MTRLFHSWIGCLSLLACLSLTACGSKDELDIGQLERRLSQNNESPHSPYFLNNPLPIGQGHLRILAIGNSFTIDALRYVSDILTNLGVDKATYSLYGATHSSASLEHWCEQALQDSLVELTHWGGAKMDVEQGTMQELLAQSWDVVVLIQKSEDAIHYETFNPWLHQLIDHILQHCPNPNLTLAWEMSWSYNDTYVTTYSNYGRWLLIALAAQTMTWNDGIDVVIPVGTAIQNARNTDLNSESQLTRDGWHLNEGVGCYIAACTVVQSLFAPVFGISILNDTMQIQIPQSPDTTHVYPLEPVTDENRPLCHQCVINAIEQPFNITKQLVSGVQSTLP